MISAFILSAVCVSLLLGRAVALFCPTGYLQNGNFCYDFRYSFMDNNACSAACANAGAHMLCVQNTAQQNFIWDNHGSDQLWIGYFKVDYANGVWEWYSGCTSTYTNWDGGEGYDPSQHYAMMYSGYSGRWADELYDRGPDVKCACQMDALEESKPPTASPSVNPSVQPTSQPTSQPNSSPTSQPSMNPEHVTAILSSPTYKPRNGYAFAALTTAGSVEAWGGADYGGDASAVLGLLASGVTSITHARFAFAALKSDGTAVLWGALADTITTPSIQAIAGQERGFALAATTTGAVYARSSCDDAADPTVPVLASGASYVVASATAFVAVKTDGTAFAWGDESMGGSIPTDTQALLTGVTKVVATRGAFAALLSTGRVVAWGDASLGGQYSIPVGNMLTDVWHLSSSRFCFVAYKQSGGVVVWGNPAFSDTTSVASQLTSGVVHATHTFTASAALKSDGTVVTWGQAAGGGDSSAVQAQLHDVAKLYANGKAFAALTTAGKVVVWGKASDGGDIPVDKLSALASGVVSIAHTDRAFAALKSDGSLVVWGKAGRGGSLSTTTAALLSSGVHTVCANDAAFSAIKTDGKVVAWGHQSSVLTEGVQFSSAQLASGAQCV